MACVTQVCAVIFWERLPVFVRRHVSLHESRAWSLVGSGGRHMSRRYGLSRPTLFFIFRIMNSSHRIRAISTDPIHLTCRVLRV